MLLVSEPILGEEEKSAVLRAIDSGWITMRDRVRRFERAFADRHGFGDAVAVSSCTAGLHLALLALGVGPGDEVLVPSLTFVATVNAVLYVGAKPVFVDIVSLQEPHACLSDAAEKCGARTKAAMVMHYAGYLVDLPAWHAFAASRGLVLIEDAAHAVGAPEVGLLADAAAFSFFGNKNMTTGEGGMVVARDPRILDAVRLLRSHGMTSSSLQRLRDSQMAYDVTMIGYNYRMDELRAALGLVQIERLEAWNQHRRRLTGLYRTQLREVAPEACIPFDNFWPSAYHILPVLLPEWADRAKIVDHLRRVEIQTTVHYPPVHRFSLYRERWPDVALPYTEQFATRELTLPLHPKLDEEDVGRVADAFAGALREARAGVLEPDR